MKILVTGGAGFIGSHIVDALVARGDEVVVVDNLSTGFRKNLNPKAKFYELSIGDKELARVFERERPQMVNHQAAQTVVTRSTAEPLFDAEQNILGSLNLILKCLEFGVRKLVYASSGGAIYGETGSRPADEGHPVAALSPYGVSKHAVEHYLQLYGNDAGLDYAVLRYANVYGQRQNPDGEGGVVAIFARQMLAGEQPTIFGAGDKTRDYVHVSDVVAANLLAQEKGSRSIYNISTGVETTDRKMFDTMAELLGYQGPPRYAPVRRGEILRSCLDGSKARKELGWQPRLALGEGLAQTVAYYLNVFSPGTK
jgi:UDP-glucose 4-epimerase